MNHGFWSQLKKPIFVLAPMANVTDAAFRTIIAKNGKPDVTWTEFVSVEGLLSAGRDKLLVDLQYSEAERPIVAQIFGSNPEQFEKVARLLADMKFDGIDINMGCPDRAVVKQGAGAGCIKDPIRAQEIIRATIAGAGSLPVSVKTRLGVNKIDIENWIPKLLETEIAALTVHLRTMKEMSKVPAHWELMPEIVKIVDDCCEESRQGRNDAANLDQTATSRVGGTRGGKFKRPILLGNGDVTTLADAEQKVAETGCDGVMIGRGIFGNPWMFDRNVPQISIPERMRAMLEHTRLYEQMYSNPHVPGKNFEVMKKHYKAYVNNFDGAKELRIRLMEAKDYAEVEQIVLEHFPVLKISE